MGYRMAKNFRTKMSPNDKFIIHDVDTKVLDTFAQEVGKGVKVAKDARQVAEESVSPDETIYHLHSSTIQNDEHVPNS
jgi:hypothetical protein